MSVKLLYFMSLIYFIHLLIGFDLVLAQQESEPSTISSNTAEKEEVAAKTILKAIEEGRDVAIKDAFIVGPFQTNLIRLPREKGPDGIERSIINSRIYIQDSVFRDRVDFSEVRFDGVVNFSGTTFHQFTSFSNTRFNQNARFNDTHFVRNWTHFSETQFYVDAWFDGAQFSGPTAFAGAQFHVDARFYQTQFNNDAYFNGVEFSENAYFSGALFNESVNFSSTRFTQSADFSNVQFRQVADFSEAQLDYSSWLGTKFQDVIYFTETDLRNRMIISWTQLEGNIVYDDLFYLSIIRNFNELGQFDDADNSYYSYRVGKRDISYSRFDPRWLFEFIVLDLTCGYGVKPFRTIGVAILIILGCSIFYYRTGAIRQLSPEENQKPRSRRQRIADSLYFSINTFTTVGYGDWYPTDKPLFKLWKMKLGSVRNLAMLEGLMGWLVLALFLVTLGRVWIR